jgi:phosphohistidine phosphatase
MNTLYLLRHAKSSWDEPALPDAERPLAPRGRQAVVALRRHFAAIGLRIDLVLCSPARRAKETWDAVAPGVVGEPMVRVEPAIYEASVDDLIALVHGVDDTVRALLLVGHNPGFENLARTLAGHGDASALTSLGAGYPTGGFATLTLDAAWSELGAGRARLTALVRPRELRS